MTATVYLVRHATPDWSRTDLRYDVPPGPPLTSEGEAEAEALGQLFASVGISQIYTSPLERTRRTAEIASDHSNIPVTVEENIAEWRRGESEAQVLERCRAILERSLADIETDGPIALVTHGGPIRTLLEFIELDPAEIKYYRRLFDRDNPVPPAGVWQLTYDEASAQWDAQLIHTPKPHVPYKAASQQPESKRTETIYV